MKRTVIPIAFPQMQGEEGIEATFEINEPGDVVDCTLQVKPKVGGIVAVHDANKPQFDIIPIALISIDPDAPTKKRHFIILPPGRIIESEGEVVVRGRFLFPNGMLLILFEEILETKEQTRNLLLP